MVRPACDHPDEWLFEHAACGLLLTEPDGTITRVNATACAWLGYGPGELVGRKLNDLLTVGGRLFHQTHCVPILQVQGSIAEVQLDMRHSSGERVPVLMNVARNRAGARTVDCVALLRSVDRRAYERELLKARMAAEAALDERRAVEQQLKAANENLARADRRKDEFLATLAHELRNPLAPIRSGIDLLKLRHPNDPKFGQLLDVFDRQVQQMTHLVDDLMDVARITQGSLRLRLEPVELAPVLRSAANDVAGLVASRAHALALDLQVDGTVINADATRLTQIFVNLLTNACKYTPYGGRIRIAAGRQGGQAVIQVIDSGIGIPQADLANIFAMFTQVDAALDHSKDGLGIGLWLVKRLLEAHGGSIMADSAGIGRGSTFTVRLPVADAAAVAAPADTPRAARATSRVLLVDDNADAMDVMAQTLRNLGHEVCAVQDGAAALQRAPGFAPRFGLFDIGLPGMSGYELARRVREAPWGRDMILVAVTGWGQEADRVRSAEAGFDLHLTKPVELAQLERILAAHTCDLP